MKSFNAFTGRTASPQALRCLMIATLAIMISPATVCGETLASGETFTVGGRRAAVRKLDALPFVDNEYSRRYQFDRHDNPKLKALREAAKFDAVVAPGASEFEQQLLLLDWTHQQFKKFGQPSANARGALEILAAIENGHTFFCSQYAQLFVSAAASMGWVDRPLALRRHQDGGKGGSSEHSTTEIWSNQHRKWIMLDPTSNMYLEKDGLPLNAWEIRQEWFYGGGTNLVFVIGKERRRYRKGDLPVFLKRFAGFGDLAVGVDELDKYGFTAYIPNTDLMDAGFDYGKMFIVKDQLCEGTKWHVRKVPSNPAVEPYFPLGQAALSLRSAGDHLRASFRTLTPNFKTYEISVDGKAWQAAEEEFTWPLRAGANRLQVRTMNHFGVAGPVSTAEIELLNR